MAEIHVQTKKPSTNATWVWIVLALLVIGAVVYYMMTRNNNQNGQPIPPSQPDAASQVTPKAKPPKPERVQTVIPVVYMRSV